MIRYMLDTNICVYLIKKKPIQVLSRLQEHDISEIGISAITLSELEFGVMKSLKQEQNKIALTEFLAPLEIMPYDDAASFQYGMIRAYLQKKGTPIGSLDMLIAAHALALGCSLVTNNIKEFKRVPGLKTVNWVEE